MRQYYRVIEPDLQQNISDRLAPHGHPDGGVEHPYAGSHGQEKDKLVAVLLKLEIGRWRVKDGPDQPTFGSEKT